MTIGGVVLVGDESFVVVGYEPAVVVIVVGTGTVVGCSDLVV